MRDRLWAPTDVDTAVGAAAAAAPHDTVAARVRAALTDAASLVFPVRCAGCGAPDVALCDACAQALRPAVHVRRIGESGGLDGLDVFSGLVFDGVVANVVRALKSDGRTALAAALGPALAAAVVAAVTAHSGGGVGAGEPVVVPVPASRAALRRRGYFVVELLAHRAHVPVRRMLRCTRAPDDQRLLGRTERAQNVAGTVHARRALHGVPTLVIDDVVTTGATLGEAARALRAAGAVVIGAATVASTPRRAVRQGTP